MSAPHGHGQPAWPERGIDGTTRQQGPPIRFHPEPPPPRRSPALLWLLRGLGLLAVAVLSGVVWWYVQGEDTPEGSSGATDTPVTQTMDGFSFVVHDKVPQPRLDSTCDQHSYGKVKKFFQRNPCEQLARALYVTRTEDGRKAYVSVSVVRMSSNEKAAQLRAMADRNGTGNVNDLVKEGIVEIRSLNALNGGGYSAVQQGQNVIIVEADFLPADDRGDRDEPLLDRVCRAAVLIGQDIEI